MASSDDLTGLWVINKVTVGVCRVTDENALERGVLHLASLVAGNVDEGWASEDPEVTQIWDGSTDKCAWDAVDA